MFRKIGMTGMTRSMNMKCAFRYDVYSPEEYLMNQR